MIHVHDGLALVVMLFYSSIKHPNKLFEIVCRPWVREKKFFCVKNTTSSFLHFLKENNDTVIFLWENTILVLFGNFFFHSKHNFFFFSNCEQGPIKFYGGSTFAIQAMISSDPPYKENYWNETNYKCHFKCVYYTKLLFNEIIWEILNFLIEL